MCITLFSDGFMVRGAKWNYDVCPYVNVILNFRTTLNNNSLNTRYIKVGTEGEEAHFWQYFAVMSIDYC